MGIFCHVKKGDKVLINSGQFSGTISTVSSVLRVKLKKDLVFFKVILNDLPKRTVKNKKTGTVKQVHRMIHSSNLDLLESSKTSRESIAS